MSDAYWDQTVLLMHMDGTNSATYIRDERHNTITANGNTRISTAQKKFGVSSVFFDGAGDYLSIPTSSNLDLGNGDFTIEFSFLYQGTNNSAPCVLSSGQGAWGAGCVAISVDHDWSADKLSLSAYDHNAAAVLLAGGTTLSTGVWYQATIQRRGTSIEILLDGVLDGATTVSAPLTFNFGASQCLIGGGNWGGAGSYFNGYLDEIRITKGVARYAGDYTPSTTEFPVPIGTDQYWPNVVLSLPMSGTPGLTAGMSDLKGHGVNIFGDTKLSAAKSKFHGASCYFDGTGDYLLIPASTDFAFGTGDFTVEMWVYFTGVSMKFIEFDGSAIYLEVMSNGIIRFGGQFGQTSGATASAINTWHHVAVTRIGTLFRLLVDGVLSNTLTTAASLGTSAIGLHIGESASGGFRLSGYISNIRMTKGIGRYSGNFTPPVEPFPSAVPQALSGIVRDQDGNPTNRTVRSYRRSDGKLIGTAVSDPTTGLFSLPADSVDEHFVVVFDSVKNALVYDHITPVI